MSIGINPNIDYQTANSEFLDYYRAKLGYNYQNYQNSSINTSNTTTNKKSQKTENKVIGEDDGHIGIAAVGYAVKGAAKGLWNGIKGCFTNSEGKFSLGKTLLTLGVGAACIAFPAVGVAACALGAGMGIAKTVGGVSQVIKAQQEGGVGSDQKAIEAWEQIGDGIFTTATSVTGMKAAVGATRATSTAGKTELLTELSKTDDFANVVKNIDGLENTDDVIKALGNLDDLSDASQVAKILKQTGKLDMSKLGNLSEDATKLEKIQALLSDMGSSTVNQKNVLKNLAIEKFANARTNKKANQLNKLQENIKNAKTAKERQAARQEFNKFKKSLQDNDKINYQDIEQAAKTKNKNLKEFEKAKNDLTQAKENYKNAGKNQQGNKSKDIKANTQNELNALKQAKNNYREAGANAGKVNFKIAQKAVQTQDTIKTAAENSNIGSYASEVKDSFSQDGFFKTIGLIIKNDETIGFNQFLSTLPKDAQAIIQSINNNQSYTQAIQEFGYDKVLNVVETCAGYLMAQHAL